VDDLFDFTDYTVMVTGGSRGLGRAMAVGFARRGARLIIASRNLAACARCADEIAAAGGTAEPFELHTDRWSSLGERAQAAWNIFGGIDVLVNNAGAARIDRASVDVDEGEFDALLAVNLKGPFRLSALLGTRMAQGDGGSIINVSSLGAIRPLPAYASYAAAKAGLNALTRAHAFEFAPKVRVNAILPGAFETDLASDWTEERKASIAAAVGRNGHPDDLVTTALYLASKASGYTTGALINVDGGRH